MCGFIGMYGDERVAHEMADAPARPPAPRPGRGRHRHLRRRDVPHRARRRARARRASTRAAWPGCPGRMAVGHTRYPTVGGGTADDAQPLYTNTPFGIAMAHNGNVTNYVELKQRRSASRTGRRLGTELRRRGDPQRVRRRASTHRGPEHWFAGAGVHGRAPRSSSACAARTARAAIVGGHGLVAFRDPYGIKPAILGRRDGAASARQWCVASESAVLQVLGYEIVGDLEPGRGRRGRRATARWPVARGRGPGRRRATARACSSTSTSRAPTA